MQCYNLTKLLHEQAVIKRRADGWRIGLRQLTKKIIAKIKEGYLQELYKETTWMYQYARRYWLSICFYIVAGVFGTLMGLGSSVLSKYLIDAVTGVKKERIVIFAVLIVCMTIANILINAIISRISARINVVIQNEIQADIFGKILHTEWKELQQFRSGDLLNRLSNDAVQVASSVISWIPNSITKLVQFIGAFVIIFYYDPVMAGIALLSAPVTILFSRRMMQKMRIYNKEMREMTSGLMAFQDDTFQNIQTVKALNLTSVFEKKLQGLQNKYKEKMLDYNRFTVYTSSFMSAVGTGASYICFGWSVYRLWSGYITTGTLLMFFQMANSLSSSFSALIQIVPSAINAATCAGRLMAVSELEKEKILDKEQMAAIRKKVKKEITIEMKNITISYRDTRKVIDNGNFMAKPGEEKPEPKGGMLKLFMEMLPVIGEAAGALKRKLRIDDLTIHLTWATDDPAKTALGFGRANAILGMIWPVFDHNFKVKKHDLGVAADFDQSCPTVYCNAALTMTVGQLVAFGLRFGIKLLVIWSRNRKGPAKKQEVQS